MNIIRKRLLESISVKNQLIEDIHFQENIELVVASILACFGAKGSVYFAGNGGSAADAQHLSAELSGRFYYNREALPSEALHCNTSFLTAVANDYSFDEIYARMLHAIANKGDVLIGLSTSGNSKNILRAFEEARNMGIKTIAFTGESGGKLKSLADICICVPSEDTPRIQEAHMTIGHIVCEIVEETLFPRNENKTDDSKK